ncbi:MAG: glycine-rich domain-containing protein [Telluria sp.]
MGDQKGFDNNDLLDLTKIKAKLMHTVHGEGWSRERADANELEYRRFLYLHKLFPNENIVPFKDVDTFWHYHILDTSNYAKDCDRLFGYFLHHVPSPVQKNDEQARAHAQAAQRMRHLYHVTFGHVAGDGGGATGSFAAFCGVTAPPAQRADAAPASTGRDTSDAFCGVAAGPAHPPVNLATSHDGHSFCGVARGNTANRHARHAFCGVARRPATRH